MLLEAFACDVKRSARKTTGYGKGTRKTCENEEYALQICDIDLEPYAHFVAEGGNKNDTPSAQGGKCWAKERGLGKRVTTEDDVVRTCKRGAAGNGVA